MKKASTGVSLFFLAVFLVSVSVSAAEYSYSKDVFREQMRTRFLFPDHWQPLPIVEDSTAFIRTEPRNSVILHTSPPRQEQRIKEEPINRATTNIPYPERKGRHYLLEEEEPFMQENEYITNYERRVRVSPYRVYRSAPKGYNIGERLGVIKSDYVRYPKLKQSEETNDKIKDSGIKDNGAEAIAPTGADINS